MDKAEKKGESWQQRKKRIKHKWAVPFDFIEWNCEWCSELLKRWAFLDVLEHLGRLTILVAVVFYFTESGDRRKAKHYQAWQVINSAQGQTGSGGRIEALQDLNGDGVSLAGVDISKAYLQMVNLAEAELLDANLAEAILVGANFADAMLAVADLTGANLQHGNLSEAILFNANLAEADLWCANLSGAILIRSNLAEANIAGANLAGANLSESNLANIKDWQKVASIKYANIFGVVNPPDGFIEWAMEQGAVSMEDKEKGGKLIKKKMEEKMKQEAVNSRGDQKQVR